MTEFETPSGQNYRIELNESGLIHIHTDHVRLHMSKEEFIQIADKVSKGYEELEGIKDDV